MPTACPICDQPIAAAAVGCPDCGFPVALEADAIRARSEPVPTQEPSAPAPKPTLHVPDPQAEQCDTIARRIDRSLATLAELGGDGLPAASDLRQAALTQADGRVVEALGILRRAESRVAGQIDELFASRLQDAEERRARLAAAGLEVAVSAELATVRSDLDRDRRREAAERLRSLEERLFRLEGEATSVRDLLAQIETLRAAFAEFGPVPGEVDADLAHVKAILGTADVTLPLLDEASQTASRALMLLHEGLPPHVEEELNRHAVTLQRWPEEHAGSAAAKSLHAESVRHLRRGRLVDATSRLRELRAAIRELEATQPPPAPAPVGAGPGASDTPAAVVDTDAALDRLLLKARGLAARVRGLPPESEIAFEAAGEIRRATELLRARKLDEADLTLSRLMQTLSTAATAGG